MSDHLIRNIRRPTTVHNPFSPLPMQRTLLCVASYHLDRGHERPERVLGKRITILVVDGVRDTDGNRRCALDAGDKTSYKL